MSFVQPFGQIMLLTVHTMGQYRSKLSVRLAERLRQIRGDTPIRVIAKKAGISKSLWHLLEQAEHNTTLITIEKICHGLKCKPSDLLD